MIKISVSEICLAIALVTFAFTSNFAQHSFEDQYNIAEKFYQQREYFDCITELKRLLFFSSDLKYNYQANFLMGQCYKGGAKLDDAIKYFAVSTMYSKDKEDIYKSKIEIVKCNILRRTTAAAFQILQDLKMDQQYADKNKEILYWEGWAYIFNDDWEKASELFSKIDENHLLKKLADETADKKYSMSFAKVISYILPGSGQIYTGHILSGLLSLGWNGVLFYFTWNSFYEERIFDGFLESGLFLRFYNGNIENTEKFVKEENLKINNESLKYLQFEYKGLKP